MLAIDAKNVTKQYKGSQTPALNSISIEVQSGQIFTFLGRNGAGKTTFVRMCATQLMPTSGSIGVLGYDAVNCADRVRELITIVPQEGRPLRVLTPWDHVYNWLQIRGEYKDEARRRAREMLEKLELWQNKDTPAMYLSGGMKQKILVAMAMAVDAELLFLDEPNLEVISSLEPDLIVTTSGYYEVAYDELSAIAPTIELDYFASPNGTSTEFELMDESTMKLADALGKHDEGVKLLQERDTKLMEAKSKLEAAGAEEDRFVLLYTDVSEGIPSLTLLYNNSKPSQVIAKMGLHNSQQDGIQNGFGIIGLEALSALDGSDVHLLYTSPKGIDTFANQYGDNPVWNNLEFVEAERVHNLGNLYPWGGPVTAMELSDRVVQAISAGNTTAPPNRLE